MKIQKKEFFSIVLAFTEKVQNKLLKASTEIISHISNKGVIQN